MTVSAPRPIPEGWCWWCGRLRTDETMRRIIQGIFLLLGVGVLLPWNAFISAKPYFLSRYCEEPGDMESPNIESTFAAVYNSSAVSFLGLIILLQWVRDQCSAGRHHRRAAANGDGIFITEDSNSTRNNVVIESTDTRSCSSSSMRSGSSSSSSFSSSSSSSADGHSFWLVMVPLALYMTVFLGQTVLVTMLDVPPDRFKRLTLLSLALTGMCQATANAGIVATAGLFDASQGISPFLAGQSAGGVAVSIANFFAASWEDPDLFWQSHCNISSDFSSSSSSSSWGKNETTGNFVLYNDGGSRDMLLSDKEQSSETCVPYDQRDYAVFSYFLLGTLTLAACLLGYAFVDRFQRMQHRDDYDSVADVVSTTTTHDEINIIEQSPRIGLEMNDSQFGRRCDLHQDQELANNDALLHHRTAKKPDTDVPLEDENHVINGPPAAVVHEEVMVLPEEEHHHGHSSSSDNEMTVVWTAVKGPAVCIFLVFFVTLSLFPGWTSELRSIRQCSSHFRLYNDLYTPFTFLLFNTGDLIGRILAAYVPVKRIHRLSNKLVIGALLRFLFFPALFLCVSGPNANNGGNDNNTFQVTSDLYSVLIQFLFAVTNGSLVSVAFVHAPSLLSNTTHMQERSSEILNFCLACGLLAGSLFSFPVAKMTS